LSAESDIALETSISWSILKEWNCDFSSRHRKGFGKVQQWFVMKMVSEPVRQG
jgi:hypothetical protein